VWHADAVVIDLDAATPDVSVVCVGGLERGGERVGERWRGRVEAAVVVVLELRGAREAVEGDEEAEIERAAPERVRGREPRHAGVMEQRRRAGEQCGHRV
jgi:hypothetical protein